MSKKLRGELRDSMRKVLSNLDHRWVQAACGELCGQLTDLVRNEVVPAPRHILAWVAHFPGEVDLSAFISAQLGESVVYLPRTLPDRSMTFVSIDAQWMDRAEEGLLGIPQPHEESGVVYNPKWGPETAIIVPGLAFDEYGNRIGRGGGYYDRFLADPELSEATLIGVGWSLQIVPQVPVDSHDIPMDWVCHERDFFAAGTLQESTS